MNFKSIALGLIFFFIWQISAQAYPWVAFKQSQPSHTFELDVHADYFIKGQFAGFSSAGLNYHNSMVDVNLGWTYSFLEQVNYFRISELALIFPFIFKDWEMTLGFKDVLWSVADRYWNYGLWQPRYMLDIFRPVQMGLPGMYFHHEGNTSLLLMLSYFYLPDIMAYRKVRDGKITSKNPFFIDSFSGGIDWNVKTFHPFQINKFFKPVVAGQLKHSLKHSNISLAYAYKPVNQLQYSIFFSGVNLSNTDDDSLGIDDFNYSVVSHHLFSFEGEVVFSEGFSLFASLFYEKPEKQKHEKNWISDDIEPHLTFSVLSYFEEKFGEKSKTLFTLGYTQTIESSSERHISNIITEDQELSFSRNFNWIKALSASIEYQDKSILRGLLSRFRASYALDNGFYVLALENYFNLTSHIQVYLSGDALFRTSSRDIKKGTSSISQYKKLSRVFIGGKYVF